MTEGVSYCAEQNRRMRAYARALIHENDVEDVVQEAWILLLRGQVRMHAIAVKAAAKDWRSRHFGRTRAGKKTRTFIHFDALDQPDDILHAALSRPAPVPPATLHARAVNEDRRRAQKRVESATPQAGTGR